MRTWVSIFGPMPLAVVLNLSNSTSTGIFCLSTHVFNWKKSRKKTWKRINNWDWSHSMKFLVEINNWEMHHAKRERESTRRLIPIEQVVAGQRGREGTSVEAMVLGEIGPCSIHYQLPLYPVFQRIWFWSSPIQHGDGAFCAPPFLQRNDNNINYDPYILTH